MRLFKFTADEERRMNKAINDSIQFMLEHHPSKKDKKIQKKLKSNYFNEDVIKIIRKVGIRPHMKNLGYVVTSGSNEIIIPPTLKRNEDAERIVIAYGFTLNY